MPRRRSSSTEEPAATAVERVIPDFEAGAAGIVNVHACVSKKDKGGAFYRDLDLRVEIGDAVPEVGRWPKELAAQRGPVVEAVSGVATHESKRGPKMACKAVICPVSQGKAIPKVWEGRAELRFIKVQAADGSASVRWTLRIWAGQGYGNMLDQILGNDVEITTIPAQGDLPLGKSDANKPPLKMVEDLPPDADEDEEEDE